MNSYLGEIVRFSLAFLVAWYRGWLKHTSGLMIQLSGLLVVIVSTVVMYFADPPASESVLNAYVVFRDVRGLAFIFISFSMFVRPYVVESSGRTEDEDEVEDEDEDTN